jgi:hypothetical protein
MKMFCFRLFLKLSFYGYKSVFPKLHSEQVFLDQILQTKGRISQKTKLLLYFFKGLKVYTVSSVQVIYFDGFYEVERENKLVIPGLEEKFIDILFINNGIVVGVEHLKDKKYNFFRSKETKGR